MAIANGPRPRPPGRAPADDFKRASQLKRGEHQTGTPEAADAREEASRAESKFTAQCRNQVNTCAIVIVLT